MSDSLNTLAELKAAVLADSPARTRLTYLFDDGNFTELDPYAKNGSDLSGVIAAFGYVDSNPVYAFSQDINVKSGAVNKTHAAKIVKVLDLAAKTGVPVVGIFDSFGADISDGAEALNSYGNILAYISNLSGVVPIVSVVAGTCAGCSAMIAQSADFVVMSKDAELYVAPNSKGNSAVNAAKNGTASVVCDDDHAAVNKAKEIINKFPQNNLSPVPMYEFAEPTTIIGTDAETFAKAVCDEDSIIELGAEYGKCSYTAIASVGGATVGFIATNKTADKITSADASKIARFVRTCDAYQIPVVTLVDTEGFAADDDTEVQGAVKDMAKLTHAYAEATTIKVSFVVGKAYGPAFIALAGKGSNSDLTYALNGSVISPLAPETAVEFLQHDELKGVSDLTSARKDLADKYAKEKASAVAAAASGCVDGIIESSEIRETLKTSIEILAGKRVSRLPKKHSNIQL